MRKRIASQFNFRVKGTNNLIAKLNQAADLGLVKEVLVMNAAELQEKAMRNAPNKTGHLQGSITVSSDLAKQGMEIRVKANADYASYVEWGTRYMYARPYMRPAYKEQIKQFKADMKRIMK